MKSLLSIVPACAWLSFAQANKLPETAMTFERPQSVWVKGQANEINGFYGFVASFGYDGTAEAKVTYTAASLARVWVNGKFAGYGPARAPEGFARQEELTITPLLQKGGNVIAFEVLSPRVNAFDLMDRRPFLRAEVTVGGKPVAWTGRDFKAVALNRVKKTSRFSYQRGPAEVLDVSAACDAWRTVGVVGEGLELEHVGEERILPRGTAYPKFELDRTFRPTVRTTFGRDASKPCPEFLTKDKLKASLLKGYAKDELEVNVLREIYNLTCKPDGEAGTLPVRLSRGRGVVLEGATEVAGFPRMKVRCLRPAKLWLLMDEYAGEDGIPNPLRMWHFSNAFGYRLLEPGEFEIENFDATAFKAAHLVVDEGEIELLDFAVRTYGNPNPDRARFHSSDPKLDAVFAAAQRSLKWNSADFYTDCPGRERGIYFGDTIFTGRAGDVLMGDLAIERSMFEAFALPEKFPVGVPDGMVPMLYPGDTTLASAHWIPNFGLWSVVQLADHVRRTGDRTAAEAYCRRATDLLAWFRKCRNADGLLEKVPGWVFVEWSDAAKFTQDVSYLTNMTYVKFLEAMAEVYSLADCKAEAENARQMIRRQSWTGEWFTDNAVRQKDGTLKTTGECTESAQYFAFFSGVATPERDPELWKRVVEDLGPMRKTETYPKLYRSNLLFGYSIRFVLLSEAGLSKRVLDEVRHCFYHMAQKTGTLWEGVSPSKGFSCCHGFPSMAAWLLARDALGLKRIDRSAKTVEVSVPADNALDFCEGTIPVSETEEVRIAWRRKDGKAEPVVDLSAGWSRRY